MVSQKRVKSFMRKMPGSRSKVRVKGHLRQVDGRLKANK